MNIFAGSTEIQMLCWRVVLGLAQLMIAATTMATKDQGLPYNMSPRGDCPRRRSRPLACAACSAPSAISARLSSISPSRCWW